MQIQASAPDTDSKAHAGAYNLLHNCVGVAPGQSILIVGEDHAQAFFDPALCEFVKRAATELGAVAEVIMAPQASGPDDFPLCIGDAMRRADHTVFLSRIGDQVRFCPLPGSSTKTMCYTHDITYLRDEFATIPYGLFAEVTERLLGEITGKRTCRITCPNGTELAGDLLPVASDTSSNTQAFSVGLFPVMITPPISGAGLSGRLALRRWLTSSSTHAYEHSLLQLRQPLFALIESGRIVGFEGDAGEVERVDRHFNHVACLVGGDPYAMNSWHAGTNPKTFFAGDLEQNIEKWSDIVYGSPRYAHFHMCGNNPGDIAVSLIDATISFGGEKYWDDGRLVFLERPDVRAILDRYPGNQSAFDMRWDIGI